MITNTLMIKLKERKNTAQAKAALLSMEGKINELRDIQVEIDIKHGDSSYDILLVTRFSSIDDMSAYLAHPIHIEVSKYIADATETLASVCYGE